MISIYFYDGTVKDGGIERNATNETFPLRLGAEVIDKRVD